ncbi:MAG TPA: nuclear transport factor 2 family protein [Saprospiraceae bacterium]|nr:nuclear transport factor 2 family protein [Saprospiraceae bacterium]
MRILSIKIVSALFVLLALFASCDDDQMAPEMSQKEKVSEFLQAVNNRDVATIEDLVREDYIQHNPFIPTGRDPFVGLLTTVLEENGTTVENIRLIEDGKFVAAHNLWVNAAPFGADTVVTFDILRFDENGKIAEHWDAIQAWESQTVSGRTMIDGPTTIADLEQTEANKALAVTIIEDVLMGQNPENITNLISAEQYHQHNPGIGDGLEGIQAAVEYLISIDNMFEYTTIHKVIGEGNFVLTVSEGQWNDTSNAFYDLFRFEDGKAVEHWDVIQAIPTEGLANENGMFNF